MDKTILRDAVVAFMTAYGFSADVINVKWEDECEAPKDEIKAALNAAEGAKDARIAALEKALWGLMPVMFCSDTHNAVYRHVYCQGCGYGVRSDMTKLFHKNHSVDCHVATALSLLGETDAH